MAIGRNDYDERKEARIDRFNDASAKAHTESQQQYTRASRIAERFEGGQPILVGHHSEKRARNDQKKIWDSMERSVGLNDKAAYYAEKAEAASNNNAISSDNPDAVALLEEKIEKLEKRQAEMKDANAYWRKFKTMKGFPGISDERASQIDEEMKSPRSWMPYESFTLTNNNAKIRQAKKRLQQLRALDEMPAEVIPFDGGEIEVDIEENRVKIRFDERQNDKVTAEIKAWGFKWSPTNKCWQRLRTKGALRAARRVCGVDASKTVVPLNDENKPEASPVCSNPVKDVVVEDGQNKPEAPPACPILVKEVKPVKQWDLAKVKWNRLAPFDDTLEVIMRMGEEKSGATQVVFEMISTKYLVEIYMCDDLKLYGDNLYMLWNDCCQRNYEKLSDLLYKYHLGKISDLFIKRHILPGRSVPIKTFDEWVDSSKSIDEFFQTGDIISENFIAFYSEMGEKAVIQKETLMQLRTSNHSYINEDGILAPLYSTFKLANGVWSYVGLCEKLPDNFCAVCPCHSCLRSMPDGSKEDCVSCDICIDGDISPLSPHCPLDKRGADLLKVCVTDE